MVVVVEVVEVEVVMEGGKDGVDGGVRDDFGGDVGGLGGGGCGNGGGVCVIVWLVVVVMVVVVVLLFVVGVEMVSVD